MIYRYYFSRKVDDLFMLKLAYESNLNDRLDFYIYFENCGG